MTEPSEAAMQKARTMFISGCNLHVECVALALDRHAAAEREQVAQYVEKLRGRYITFKEIAAAIRSAP